MAKKKEEREFVSFADFQAYENSIFPEEWEDRKWTTIEERDAMLAKLQEMYKRLMPEVGMGATEILYSDRRAKTIVEVISPDKVVVRENEVRCENYYAGTYEILDELSLMPAETFTRRKSGRWVELGQPDKFGSVYLRLGHRDHYIDPSF